MNERRNALITGASAGHLPDSLPARVMTWFWLHAEVINCEPLVRRLPGNRDVPITLLKLTWRTSKRPNPSTLQRRGKDLKSITWSTMQALRDLICCRTGSGVIRHVFTS